MPMQFDQVVTAVQSTCLSMDFVLSLLNNYERVPVAMTSLELDLQTAESVSNTIVQDTHNHERARRPMPQCSSAAVAVTFSTLY